MIIRHYKHETDFESAANIIRQHSHMYGYKINHEAYINHLIQSQVTTTNRWFSIEDKDTLYGVACQIFWKSLPVWSVTNMFFNEAKNSRNAVQAGKLIFEAMTTAAERKNIFQFYYIVRDNGSLRKNISLSSNPALTKKYDIVDVEVLHPFQKSSSEVFTNMLGNIHGKNSKTIVIRQGFLKSEFRPDIWQV